MQTHDGQPTLLAIRGKNDDILARLIAEHAGQSGETLASPREALDALIAGKAAILLLTDAQQVQAVLDQAEHNHQIDALHAALRQCLIGTLDPTVTQTLEARAIRPDYEADPPELVSLVRDLWVRAGDLLEKKRCAHAQGIDTLTWQRTDMRWPTDGPRRREDSVFLKACRREPVPYTPVWLMRQAGRYQHEYRKIRAQVSMLELCKTPQLAAEVTLMAVDRLGVDAAIIFADILLLLEAMGLDLSFEANQGPVIANPVRKAADLDRLTAFDVKAMDYVGQAVAMTRRALRPDIALIGFAGAPFTVASYVIEGGKSKMFERTKAMMYEEPETWHSLMQRISEASAAYLNMQIDAGADAVQLFDSWVGNLGPSDYERFVMPHVQRLIRQVDKRVPVIHFATGNPALLELMKQAGGEVIGVDWRVDLDNVRARFGDDVAVMGNLDPAVLLTSPATIRQAAQNVLTQAGDKPGHIFNLGHGITPQMHPWHVLSLVESVHQLSGRG